MQYPFIRRQLNMGDIIRENREIRDPDEHFKNVVLWGRHVTQAVGGQLLDVHTVDKATVRDDCR